MLHRNFLRQEKAIVLVTQFYVEARLKQTDTAALYVQ